MSRRSHVPALRSAAASGLLWLGLAGCGQPPTPTTSGTFPTSSGPSVTGCRETFARWVAGAGSLNSPGVDLGATLVAQERAQREVFERCSLAEAERLNREIQVEYVPGRPQPLIEPDFRTFAEVECVDEAPQLDGTALCAEVGH